VTDHLAPHYPVSVKAVLFVDGLCVLLRNDRGEWELPGGKLERGDTMEDTIVREIEEELGIRATVERIVDSWVYSVNGVDVVIITYLLASTAAAADLRLSAEHQSIGRFAVSAIEEIDLPQGYRDSIRRAVAA
jgi:8-oxo-dGTP pyrophosphatase MutT (NUDIX family)